MSRRKSGNNKGSDPVNNLTGLREPFPSSPTKPPKYAVYGTYPHDAEPGQSRVVVVPFLATYAAKRFVEALLQGGSFKWLAADKQLGRNVPDTVVGENGVRVRCDLLEEIIEYEYTEGEAQWELPDETRRHADMVRREVRDEPEGLPTEGGGEDRPKKPKKEPKPEKVKVDKSGLVTVGDIAEQMGIEARDARAALRKKKVEKPDVGWAWAPDKVEDIKKVIKSGLK